MGAECHVTDWRVHPGEILRETLDERGIYQADLARATGYSPKHINQIVMGYAAISPVCAILLEEALDIGARFWLHAQADYDLHLTRERRGCTGSEPGG